MPQPSQRVQPRFLIPAGDPNAEVKAVAELKQDTIVTSLTPHMHVRGKDMTYIAHYQDGTSETLLSVPKWDFNWQITYMLAKPKLLPKGTTRLGGFNERVISLYARGMTVRVK